jgi:type IV pilus assembly protein PilX
MSNMALKPKHFQRGISLVIVLIFLTVLSLLGITMIQGSTLGARIARNEADRNLAFQAAEAALRDAENDIRYKLYDGSDCPVGGVICRTEKINGTDFDTPCLKGLCAPYIPGQIGSVLTEPIWTTASNWSPTGPSVEYGTYTNAPDIPTVASQPRYLIERFKIFESEVVRITAIGYGLNRSTRTMVQTTLKVRLS